MSTRTFTARTPGMPHRFERLRFRSADPAAPTPGPAPTDPAAPTSPAATPPAPGDETTDWQAQARKWEQRAKDNKTAAEELAALKAAQMTETEKAAARLAELESKVTSYETKERVAGWKAQVASTSGVPAAALAGNTLEDIQAHAELLKPLIGTPADPAAPRGPVVPTEGAGTPGGQGVTQLTEQDLKSMTPEQINQARREGRLTKLLGGL